MREGQQRNPLHIYLLGILLLAILLGLNFFSPQEYFALPLGPYWGETRTVYRTFQDFFSLTSLILAGYIFAKLCHYFLVLDLYSGAIAAVTFVTGSIALGIQIDWASVGALCAFIALLSLYWRSYQCELSTDIYLRIGLCMSALCAIEARTLYLLPLLFMSSYTMKSLSMKNSLAFFIGLITPVLIGIPLLALLIPSYDLLEFIRAWSTTLIEIAQPEGYLSQHIEILILAGFALIACLTAGLDKYTESVRWRANAALLITWTLYTLPIILLFPSSLVMLATLLASSALGSRAIGLSEGRIHKILLSTLALVLVIVCIIS